MRQLLRITPSDNVAVALQPLAAGTDVSIEGLHVTLRADIPAGHKVALTDLGEGQNVTKYDAPIGHATCHIAKGGLVDHHNIATNLSGTLDYSTITPAGDSHYVPASPGERTFLGYVRTDGQVGIRNDIWVIPTVGCVNGICRQIARRAQTDGGPVVTCFTHNYGCSQLGDDHENTRRILRAMALHPNAGGVLVVGLGCENNQPRDFEAMLGDYDRRRIRFLVCQQTETDEVEAGVTIVRELCRQAQSFARTRVPIFKLRVGLKCGGSDAFSGITANPLLGAFTDWLCMEQGGTAVLTEVPEMFGAETILMRRAVSETVLRQTADLINSFKTYYLSHGQPVGENPSPGNKAGGISTLEEKALGCTQKAGTAPVCGVLRYGDRLCAGSSGLHLLAAPGNDLVASTALAAAGCQIVLFTTGRGTPFATFVPTLKIASNSDIARRKPQWTDFDAGTLLEGTPMHELMMLLADSVIATASGLRPTQAELHGNADFAIFKNGVTL